MPTKPIAVLLLAALQASAVLAQSPVAEEQKKLRALFVQASFARADLPEMEGNDEQRAVLSRTALSYNEFLKDYPGLGPEEVYARVKELGAALDVGQDELQWVLPLYLSHGGQPSDGMLRGAPPSGDRAAPPPQMSAAAASAPSGDFGRFADGGGSPASPDGQPAVRGKSRNHTPRKDDPKTSNQYPSSAIPRRLSAGLGKEIPSPRAEAARILSGLPPPSAGDEFLPEPDRLMAGRLKGILVGDPKAVNAREYLARYDAFIRSGKLDAAALKGWEGEVQAYLSFKQGSAPKSGLPDIPSMQSQEGPKPDVAQAEACWAALAKENPTLAQWCADKPKTAAILSGVWKAIKEQGEQIFSLGTALMILGTMLIGGLLSGGVADLVILLVTIGFSLYMAYKIISEYGPKLYEAIRDLMKSRSGSKESFSKWKDTAYYATTTLVAIIMVALGAKGAQGLTAKLSKLSGSATPSMAALWKTVSSPKTLMNASPGIIPQAASLRAAAPEMTLGSSYLTATAAAARSVAAGVKARLPGAKVKEAVFAGEEPVVPGEKPVGPAPKTVKPATPQMAENKARMSRAVKEQFEVTAEEFGKGTKGPEGFVNKLQKMDALPENAPLNASAEVKARALAARENAVAKMAQDFLGFEERPRVTAPGTDPLSGAQIFVLEDAQGNRLGVVKVFVNNGKGPLTIMNELGAGREFGAQKVKLSRPVETLGAARLGDTGEIAQFMEAAPGKDGYKLLKDMTKLPEGSAARQKALAEVEADVATTAKAIAERHNASTPGKMTLEAKQESLGKAFANLEEMRPKLSEPMYHAMKARLKTFGDAFLAEDIPGRITHGDAHPGNFFIKDGHITMIDMETAMEAVGSRGEGINSPLADAARFVESIRVNNKAKGLDLTPQELSAVENTFLDAYAREMKIPAEAFKAHLDYYRGRLQITALKYAKDDTAFGKIFEAVKADPAFKGVAEAATPEMAHNQVLIQQALREQFERGGKDFAGGGQTAEAFVGKLQRVEALPQAKVARQQAVAEQARRYLGRKEPLEVVSPETDPTSGAQIYKLKNPGPDGELVGVYKVFTADGRGPLTIMNELGAGRAYDGMGLKLAEPVKTLGAFRLGESGETGFLMEAAPGESYYKVFKGLGKAEGPARAAALPKVEGQVEILGKAMAEMQNSSPKGDFTRAAKRENIAGTLKKLDAIKNKLPPELYASMKERVTTLGKEFAKADVPGTIAHGDAHPGNFYIKDGKVFMIDMESSMEAVGPAGEGIHSPVADAAFFVESLRLNNKAKGLGLSEAEVGTIEKRFLEAYSSELKIPRKALEVHLAYFRAQTQIGALKHVKGAEKFQLMLDAVKADPGLNPEALALPKSLGAAAAPIQLTSRIKDSPFAIRQAESLSQQAQRDVNSLLEQFAQGSPEPGIGTKGLRDGFFELRGRNAGRVILKRTSPTSFDIVGKFQAHARGDDAHSALIQRLIDDYNARRTPGR